MMNLEIAQIFRSGRNVVVLRFKTEGEDASDDEGLYPTNMMNLLVCQDFSFVQHLEGRINCNNPRHEPTPQANFVCRRKSTLKRHCNNKQQTVHLIPESSVPLYGCAEEAEYVTQEAD